MIPSSFFYEVLQKCCRVKTSFSLSKRAQLPAIGITELTILLTMSKVNRPGYKFSNFSLKTGSLIEYSSSSSSLNLKVPNVVREE